MRRRLVILLVHLEQAAVVGEGVALLASR
eukprot:COSAG06_NODE_19440_length_838_cov_1.562923_3_plen_28_part_01